MEKMNQTDDRNKKSRYIIIILLVVVLLMAGAIIWVALSGQSNEAAVETANADFFDPLAETGLLPGMTEAEIEAELNRVVEEGMLNIAISGELVFRDGASQGAANIVNSEANHYVQKVRITLDETGETVYESGGIKPGQYIQYITLDQVLPAGEYPATATFTAYTEDGLQEAGSAAAKITLYIRD